MRNVIVGTFGSRFKQRRAERALPVRAVQQSIFRIDESTFLNLVSTEKWRFAINKSHSGLFLLTDEIKYPSWYNGIDLY